MLTAWEHPNGQSNYPMTPHLAAVSSGFTLIPAALPHSQPMPLALTRRFSVCFILGQGRTRAIFAASSRRFSTSACCVSARAARWSKSTPCSRVSADDTTPNAFHSFNFPSTPSARNSNASKVPRPCGARSNLNRLIFSLSRRSAPLAGWNPLLCGRQDFAERRGPPQPQSTS
jgi:hypothetical protein